MGTRQRAWVSRPTFQIIRAPMVPGTREESSDSVVLGRLRCAGFTVVDQPRPRVIGANELAVNHGGIVAIAAAGISLSTINAIKQPSTFELLCARAVTGRFAATIVIVYRPGSTAVTQKFFDEFAEVLDWAATRNEPIYIVGDFNIRLDRTDDPHADRLRLLTDCCGLVLHPTGPTHDLGGTLDAVITHDTAGRPDSVSVHDVGLSDHFLLRWRVDTSRRVGQPPELVNTRPWRHLDLGQLRSALYASRLCSPDTWPADVDEMASLYDDELRDILDVLLPARVYPRRPRPSDPWFDKQCREAKRLTRRLERASAAASRRAAAAAAVDSSYVTVADSPVAKAAAARAAWLGQRRCYRKMRQHKSAEFWRRKVEVDRSNPRRLWATVDSLAGRGKALASAAIDAEVVLS